MKRRYKVNHYIELIGDVENFNKITKTDEECQVEVEEAEKDFCELIDTHEGIEFIKSSGYDTDTCCGGIGITYYASADYIIQSNLSKEEIEDCLGVNEIEEVEEEIE